MAKTVKLGDIHDGLEGHWWQRIRAADFAFQTKIPDHDATEVDEGDVLIHKQYLKDDMGQRERFPTTRYHLIVDGSPLEVDGKDVRKSLARQLTALIVAHSQLPFGCEYKKLQQDGQLVLNYSPNASENFQFKLDASDLEKLNITSESAEGFFSGLSKSSANPLSESGDTTTKIAPISESPVLEQVSAEGAGKVFVFNANIKEIDLRKSFFEGNETTYYLLNLSGAQVASNDKKDTLRRDCDLINVKASDNSLKNFQLKVGDVISFNGQLKNDRSLKIILQNVRKFENHSSPALEGESKDKPAKPKKARKKTKAVEEPSNESE